MAYVKYHDTTYSPVGLWNLNNSLSDSSGNGFDLTVSSGTARYTDIYPGVRGMALDGATLLTYNTSGTSLAITGDMTIEMLLIPRIRNTATRYVSYDATSGSLGSDNTLYSVGLASTTFAWEWKSQHGTNTNDVYDSNNTPGLNILVHYAVTRTSNVIQHYLNGQAWGSASSALTTPTGGSISKFHIGQVGGSAPNSVMASVKIIASALTAAQVKNEYNSTLGNFYGYL